MNRIYTRESQASVALIRDDHDNDQKYLCQWSDTWRALHFIGGHRDGDETFHNCAVREVLEELPVNGDEFAVPAEPMAKLDYVTFSASARVPTRYVMAVYSVSLSPQTWQAIDSRVENRWVTREEIRTGWTVEGIKISSTAELILNKLGL